MTTHGLTLRARGMHCTGCEHIIENSVAELAGVHRIKADYPTDSVAVVFDPALTNAEEIRAAIARKGYRCSLQEDAEAPRPWAKKLAAVILGGAGILFIIYLDTRFISESGAPDVSQHMGYGLIFLLGLLTGFHCVGMCGGFVLSYTAADASFGKPSYRSHALYGAGKTLSYAGIGALFGLVGAVITFTPLLRGIAGVSAGLFLIVFGLNMLSLFAPLRKIRLKLPASLELFVGKQSRGVTRPFGIGLLNGLNIACGPLQAMYVMAAGTGSAIEGAKMLATFGVGTLPVLLSFGVLTTFISGALTHQLLRASGAILIILGAVMINRGLILTGSGYDLHSMIQSLSMADQPTEKTSSPLDVRAAVQTIIMDVTGSGFSPDHFTLRKGVPVRWIINGEEITPCNRRIVVPSLGLEFDVKKGRQIVEFTPAKGGVIPWSCWMGMLQGRFEVIDEAPTATPPPAGASDEPVAPSAGAPKIDERKSAPPRGNEVPEPVPERVETYRVVPGDTLSGIAARLYRDARQWRAIAKVNPGLDPRRLHPGHVILVPRPLSEPPR